MCSIIFYIIPFVPFLSRSILCLNHRRQMLDILCEDEQDREAHRAHILALAGFSFSGLLAVAVLDVTLMHDFRYAIYYLLLGFLCYLSALNLQGYKSRRWHDQFGTALVDIASLSLILSIISIIHLKEHFTIILTILAILVWSADHLIRIRIQWNYLNEEKKGKKNGSKRK